MAPDLATLEVFWPGRSGSIPDLLQETRAQNAALDRLRRILMANPGEQSARGELDRLLARDPPPLGAMLLYTDLLMRTVRLTEAASHLTKRYEQARSGPGGGTPRSSARLASTAFGLGRIRARQHAHEDAWTLAQEALERGCVEADCLQLFLETCVALRAEQRCARELERWLSAPVPSREGGMQTSAGRSPAPAASSPRVGLAWLGLAAIARSAPDPRWDPEKALASALAHLEPSGAATYALIELGLTRLEHGSLEPLPPLTAAITLAVLLQNGGLEATARLALAAALEGAQAPDRAALERRRALEVGAGWMPCAQELEVRLAVSSHPLMALPSPGGATAEARLILQQWDAGRCEATEPAAQGRLELARARLERLAGTPSGATQALDRAWTTAEREASPAMRLRVRVERTELLLDRVDAARLPPNDPLLGEVGELLRKARRDLERLAGASSLAVRVASAEGRWQLLGGDPDAAREVLEPLSRVALRGEGEEAAAELLCRLGEAYLLLDRPDRARRTLEEGRGRLQGLTLPSLRLRCLTLLGRSLQRTGDHQAALAAFQQVLDLPADSSRLLQDDAADSLRRVARARQAEAWLALGDSARAASLWSAEEPPRSLPGPIEALEALQRGKADLQQGRLAEAGRRLEAVRAWSASWHPTLHAPPDPGMSLYDLEALFAALLDLTTLQDPAGPSRGQVDPEAASRHLLRLGVQLGEEGRLLQRRWLQALMMGGDTLTPFTPGLSRSGESALRPDAPSSGRWVLATWMGPDRSHLWLLGGGALRHFELPGRSQLAPLVHRFRGLVSEPEARMAEIVEAGRPLTELLLEPVLELLPPGVALVIVPDLGLERLPFEALPLRAGGPARWMLEAHPISYATRLEVALAGESDPRSSCAMPLTWVGDPAYPSDPCGSGRRRTGLQVSGPQRICSGALEQMRIRSARKAGGCTTRADRYRTGRNARLPTARTPAGLSSSRRADDAEQRVQLSVRLTIRGDAPQRSSLAWMAPRRRPRGSDPQETVPLRTLVERLPAGAGLLLPYCRLQEGSRWPGDTSGPLSALLDVAGSASSLITRWGVEGPAEARLLGRFHALLSSEPPALALRRARLETLRSGLQEPSERRTTLPYYWAGYAWMERGRENRSD